MSAEGVAVGVGKSTSPLREFRDYPALPQTTIRTPIGFIGKSNFRIHTVDLRPARPVPAPQSFAAPEARERELEIAQRLARPTAQANILNVNGPGSKRLESTNDVGVQ